MKDFRIAKDFLISYVVRRIQFIGGEPMLHPQLKDMITECVGKFDFIEVYTNGNYINQQWCNFFKKNKVNVAISMHSNIPEEHDRVTQVKGSHKLVKNALDLLIKSDILYRIVAIGNKDVEIGEKPKGVEYNLRIGSPRMVGRCNISQMNMDMFKERVITLETFSQKINKDFVIRSVSGHQCFSKNFYIAYDLTIYPCVMERRISHGKLNKDDSFINKDIFEKYGKDNIESCKGCEFRYVCYDCRPDAMNRSVKAKPWYCSYNPRTGEWADVEKMFGELTESDMV